MKRIASVIMTLFVLSVCFFCCSVGKASATVPAVAQTLPYTYGGITYTDVFIIEQPIFYNSKCQMVYRMVPRDLNDPSN
jgi:hypothetical protein